MPLIDTADSPAYHRSARHAAGSAAQARLVVIHLTLVISDFMVILLQAALWLAGELAAVMALAVLAAGGTWLSLRAVWRRLHPPRG